MNVIRTRTSAFDAAAHVLRHPTLAMYVDGNIYPSGVVSEERIDWPAILTKRLMMSAGEMAMVNFALQLWNGGHSITIHDVGRVVDQASWDRCVEALLILKPVTGMGKARDVAAEGIRRFIIELEDRGLAPSQVGGLDDKEKRERARSYMNAVTAAVNKVEEGWATREEVIDAVQPVPPRGKR